VQFGYPSIGCWPCTHAVEEGDDARSGRWQGQDKVECGIHVTRATPPSNDGVGGDI
jgi:phosphoadenosine phosphosulfate reductase